jgi:hypothetical protein
VDVFGADIHEFKPLRLRSVSFVILHHITFCYITLCSCRPMVVTL